MGDSRFAVHVEEGSLLRTNVTITISYADGTSGRIKVPVNAIAAFIGGLVPEAARIRRKDRASRVIIRF